MREVSEGSPEEARCTCTVNRTCQVFTPISENSLKQFNFTIKLQIQHQHYFGGHIELLSLPALHSTHSLFGVVERLCPPSSAATTFSFLTPPIFSSLRTFSTFAAGPAFEPCSSHTQRVAFVLLTSTQRRGYAKRRMPPKKEVKQEKVYLGRPGNSLKSGIVCRAH